MNLQVILVIKTFTTDLTCVRLHSRMNDFMILQGTFRTEPFITDITDKRLHLPRMSISVTPELLFGIEGALTHLTKVGRSPMSHQVFTETGEVREVTLTDVAHVRFAGWPAMG